MNPIFDTLPYLAAFKESFAVLAALSLMALVQSFLCAPLAFINNEQTPGLPVKHDHSRLSFRVVRTYANSSENLPAFGFALIAAVVAGASAPLVNWLALIYLGFRLAFWVVYYSGVGRVAGGPRTLTYVGGLLSNMVLAGAAIWALI